MRIAIIANYFYEISGGPIIYVELVKEWIKTGAEVTIFTNPKGRDFCLENGISKKNIVSWGRRYFEDGNVYCFAMYRILQSFLYSFRFKFDDFDVIFSSSDFLPDTIPPFIGKLKKGRFRWIAGCYLFHTWIDLWKRHWGKLRGIFLLLNQNISLAGIKKYKGTLLVISNKNVPKMSRTLLIRPGVEHTAISSISARVKQYDAIFIGRLHPQKNIDELINIWQEVVKKKPDARLVIVGDGPLENTLKKMVNSRGLKKNILFMNTLTGRKKYIFLKSCKLFITASRSDNGNMALDEALACGIPGVIYDITNGHYPRGVINIPIGDSTAFAQTILNLLDNKARYKKLSGDGKNFAKNFQWSKTANNIIKLISYDPLTI